MLNPIVRQTLPQTNRTQGQYATLARLDGKSIWQFLLLPPELNWERSAVYAASGTAGVPTQQYVRTDGWTLTIADLPLSTYWEERSLTDYVARLSSLQLPDAGKLAPPVLIWKWGQRLLSPCVMTRFSKVEDAWNGDGELLGCKLSFTLLQVSDGAIAR